MKELNITPADTYIVVNKSIINDQDRTILTMLYQPIIGPLPIILYFSLWADLDKIELISEEYTHHNLITNMQISLHDILEARRKLEAIGLLKTFYKEEIVSHPADRNFSDGRRCCIRHLVDLKKQKIPCPFPIRKTGRGFCLLEGETNHMGPSVFFLMPFYSLMLSRGTRYCSLRLRISAR